MAPPRSLRKNVKRVLPRKSSSSGSLECQNSLPCTSKENMDEIFVGESDNKKASKNKNSKQSASTLTDIIESRVRHFVSEEIDKDIYQIIANQCSHKLTEIIKASTYYMTRCGRLKFTTDDFNKGLFFCGKYPIICYEELLPPVKKGKQKQKRSKKLQSSSDTQCDDMNKNSQHIHIKEIWLNDISPLSVSLKDLADEEQNYFKAVADVLLYNIEDAGCIFENDLQINQNISQLVPHFVNFFCDVMTEFKCDFLKISLLLKFLNALIRNSFLYFGQDSYLNALSFALLKFLVADLPNCDKSKDSWSLKDTAANILAFILKKSKYQHLFFEVIYFVHSVLLTFKNSLNSHYGALAALNSIGVPAILLVLPSYIHRFHEHTQVILSSGNQNRLDVHMVQEQIIHSHYLLVDFYFKNEAKKPKFSSKYRFNSTFFLPDYLTDIKVFPVLSQSTFSEYFGEALLPAFNPLNFVSYSTFLRKRKKTKKNCNTNKLLCLP